MKIGAHLAAGWLADIGVVREAAQALDAAGFDHLSAGGHLLSAAPGRYPDAPDERYAYVYRDPFVLFTDLAARTQQIKFRPSILILPLYPTALVARQSADLAIASGGRFELGIGISWQGVEYAALGVPMAQRGARLEEQVVLLRRFWTEPIVTFEGRFHEVDGLGLAQLPDAPIPIHFGSGVPTERMLDRMARLADGWMPMLPEPTESTCAALLERVEAAGRSAQDVVITGRVNAAPGQEEAWAERARQVVAAGATQIVVAVGAEVELEAGIALYEAAADVVRSVVG